jgi:hypothetical protein
VRGHGRVHAVTGHGAGELEQGAVGHGHALIVRDTGRRCRRW